MRGPRQFAIVITADARCCVGAGDTNGHVKPESAPPESLTTVADVQAAMAAEGVSKTRKQKLKAQLKKLEVCAPLHKCGMSDSRTRVRSRAASS